MPTVETMGDSKSNSTAILNEAWKGQKVALASAAAFYTIAFQAGAVRVLNDTNVRIFVKGNDTDAADEADSRELDPGQADVFAVSPTTGRLSICAPSYSGATTGLVRIMSYKGAR